MPCGRDCPEEPHDRDQVPLIFYRAGPSNEVSPPARGQVIRGTRLSCASPPVALLGQHRFGMERARDTHRCEELLRFVLHPIDQQRHRQGANPTLIEPDSPVAMSAVQTFFIVCPVFWSMNSDDRRPSGCPRKYDGIVSRVSPTSDLRQHMSSWSSSRGTARDFGIIPSVGSSLFPSHRTRTAVVPGWQSCASRRLVVRFSRPGAAAAPPPQLSRLVRRHRGRPRSRW